MEETASLVGTVLAARYRVTGTLGTGGVGAVYEATDESAGGSVAIKVLRPETASSGEAAARFAREAKTMSLLEHPNIVRQLDHGIDGDTCFLVFELVRGESLRDVLASRAVEPRRAIAIIRQVLEALEHAHDRGVIHRDIKPENIMIADGRGLVKVLDFGVAKLVDDTLAVLGEGKLTRTGFSVFGTPVYLAPELALGQVTDHRIDIYSTGVVLFEMLAGRPPFVDDDPVVLLRQHASAPRPTLASVAPERTFGPELEYLVAEALAKSSKDRFSSARDMIAALDRVAPALDPIATEPPAPARRAATPRVEATMIGLTATPPKSPATSDDLPPPEPLPPAPLPPAPLPPAPLPPGPLPPAPSPPAPSPPAPSPPALAPGPSAPPAPIRIPRNVLIGGGAVLALVVIVAIAASRSSSGSKAPTGGASASGDLAQRGLDLLARGSAAEAAELLERETSVEPGRSDGAAFVALGRAQLALNRRADALGAYERAIALDGGLARDPQIKLDAIKLAESRDAVAAVIAVDILAAKVDPPAHDVIAATASHGKLPEVRRRALAVAQRDGFLDRVDRIASWSLDLEQGPTCEDRRAAANRLRAAGDARALTVLRKVRTRHACVTQDVDAAIAELETRP